VILVASSFIKQIVNRGGVVVKCGNGSCKNRTTSPTGFCHHHEGDAKNQLEAAAKGGKLEEATLKMVGGKTPITTPKDHQIDEHRNLTKYMKSLEGDLANSLALGHPLFLHGPPGVGKSAIIENFAKQYDAHLETVIGGQMTPTDVAGLPYSLGLDADGERGGTATDTPEWGKRLMKKCKEGRPGVLFFDELTNTDRQTQAAMLRLINERVFPNGEPLPKSVAIFAAGNVGDDAVVTEGLGAAMKNRFAIRECKPPLEDFLDGMASAWGREVSPSESQARTLAASFLTKFPDMAYDEAGLRSDDDTQSFATYRSWDKCAEALGRGEFINENHVRSMLTSYIGETAGEEFYAYMNGLDLPDPADVVKDPKSVDWNNIDSDKAFAIMLSVRSGPILEKDPIGTLKLYTHVAGTKSQQYAASTLGGIATKVRDAWLRNGNHDISRRDEYMKDPTYNDYKDSYAAFSKAFAHILDEAGLSNVVA
jgi:hypothetical protein